MLCHLINNDSKRVMLRHLTLRLAKYDDSERATAVTLPHKHDDSDGLPVTSATSQTRRLQRRTSDERDLTNTTTPSARRLYHNRHLTSPHKRARAAPIPTIPSKEQGRQRTLQKLVRSVPQLPPLPQNWLY